jgi:hypothetical protein
MWRSGPTTWGCDSTLGSSWTPVTVTFQDVQRMADAITGLAICSCAVIDTQMASSNLPTQQSGHHSTRPYFPSERTMRRSLSLST